MINRISIAEENIVTTLENGFPLHTCLRDRMNASFFQKNWTEPISVGIGSILSRNDCMKIIIS